TDELRADPYPTYRAYRTASPVLPSAVEPGSFVLFRYQDCLDVLRDARWSSNPGHRVLPEPLPDAPLDLRTAAGDGGPKVLLFLDPPDHTRLRKLVSKAFTPRTVERLRPRIQELVDDILDEAEARGGLDVIADLGYKVPVTVICELMGVPVADRD